MNTFKLTAVIEDETITKNIHQDLYAKVLEYVLLQNVINSITLLWAFEGMHDTLESDRKQLMDLQERKNNMFNLLTDYGVFTDGTRQSTLNWSIFA